MSVRKMTWANPHSHVHPLSDMNDRGWWQCTSYNARFSISRVSMESTTSQSILANILTHTLAEHFVTESHHGTHLYDAYGSSWPDICLDWTQMPRPVRFRVEWCQDLLDCGELLDWTRCRSPRFPRLSWAWVCTASIINKSPWVISMPPLPCLLARRS